MGNLPIVEILNVGLSGFCFLLFLLAHNSLQKEQKRDDEPRPLIMDSINKSRQWSVIVAVLVGGVTLLSSVIDKGNVDEETVISDFTNSLPIEVASPKPDTAKANISGLITTKNKLQDQVDLLKSEMARLDNNFLMKVVNINNDISLLGPTSINPNYPNPLDPEEHSKKIAFNKKLQDILAELDQYNGEIDGNGLKTREALITYQNGHDFSKTGFFAQSTIKWLVLDYFDREGE